MVDLNLHSKMMLFFVFFQRQILHIFAVFILGIISCLIIFKRFIFNYDGIQQLLKGPVYIFSVFVL